MRKLHMDFSINYCRNHFFVLEALCAVSCQNGGTCVAPERCKCRPGYTGVACETGWQMPTGLKVLLTWRQSLHKQFLNFISKIFFDSTAKSERHKCNEVTLIVLQQYHSALDCKMAITKTKTTVTDTFSVQMASCTKRTVQLD